MNKKEEKSKLGIIPIDWYIFIACCLWTVLISGFFLVNIHYVHEETKQLAIKEARENIRKDNAIRFWAASHGGVYVPVDTRTPPNLYLKNISERDIKTPSGINLTLMNPAYMLRQVMEDYSEQYGIKGKLTSLKPLRPGNAPDEWEKKALNILQNGARETYEFTEINGEPHLRLMLPLVTEKPCLKCHAFQGYVVGDIRGGVGVAIPLIPLKAFKKDEIRFMSFSHLTIWILGIIGIILSALRIKKDISMIKISERALQKSHDELELKIEKRTADLLSLNEELEKEISERKNAEEKLKTLSVTDDLTGLYNRRGFFDFAGQQMHIAERAKKGFTLFFIDMNDLKKINDIHGHSIGDRAITDLSDILKSFFRRSDIIARMGGDEFVVLLIDGKQADIKTIINNLLNKIHIFNDSGKRDFKLYISIGAVWYDPDNPVSLDDLVNKADKLMYVDKMKIKNKKDIAGA